jgi:hypothetical protein
MYLDVCYWVGILILARIGSTLKYQKGLTLVNGRSITLTFVPFTLIFPKGLKYYLVYVLVYYIPMVRNQLCFNKVVIDEPYALLNCFRTKKDIIL